MPPQDLKEMAHYYLETLLFLSRDAGPRNDTAAAPSGRVIMVVSECVLQQRISPTRRLSSALQELTSNSGD